MNENCLAGPVSIMTFKTRPHSYLHNYDRITILTNTKWLRKCDEKKIETINGWLCSEQSCFDYILCTLWLFIEWWHCNIRVCLVVIKIWWYMRKLMKRIDLDLVISLHRLFLHVRIKWLFGTDSIKQFRNNYVCIWLTNLSSKNTVRDTWIKNNVKKYLLRIF